MVADRPLPGVHAETPAGLGHLRLRRRLNAGTGDALDAMVTWMPALLGVDRPTALALASTAVDLRVTQVANETLGACTRLLPAAACAELAGHRRARPVAAGNGARRAAPVILPLTPAGATGSPSTAAVADSCSVPRHW